MKLPVFVVAFILMLSSSLHIFSQCNTTYPACNPASELQSNTCGGTYTPTTTFQITCQYQRDGDYAQFNLTAGKSYFFTTSETMVGNHSCDAIGWQAMYLHRPDGTCVEFENGSVTVCMFYEVPAGASGVYKLRMQENPCNDNSCSAQIGYQEVTAPQYVGPYLANTNVTICAGQSVTLGSNPSDDYLGADSYWFTGSCGGTPVGTGATLTVSPSTTTTYYVRNRNRDCHGLLSTYTSCDQITVTVQNITSQPANIALCPNTSGNLTCTATAGMTFQWQFNNAGTWQNVSANVPSGFTYLNPTTNNLTVNAASPSAGSYQFRCVVTGGGGCTIASNTCTVTISQPNAAGLTAGDYLWKGGTLAGDGVTYNWGNAANWLVYNGPGNFSAPTVRPYSTSNVRIKPTGTCITGQPTVNGTGLIIDDSPSTVSNMCKDIVIESGATLTFQASGNRHLHVTGNYSNYGTVVPNDGRVKFYRSGNQTVFDNSGNANFYEVEVNSTSTVSLTSTNLNISNSLRLNGVIVTGSNRVWLNTTSIDGASTGVVDGNYGGHIFGTFRRTIQNNNATYRFPVGVTATLNTGRRLLEYINNGVVGPSHLDCFATFPFKGSGNNVDAMLDPTKSTEWGQFLDFVHPEAIWTLTPGAAFTSGSYGLRLYVQNFATIDGTLDNKFAILKRPTSSTTFYQFDAFDNTTTIPNGGLPGRVWNSGNGYAEKLGFTQFSEFVIASAPLPLSVELKSIQLECASQGNRLSWSTATEHDNDFFKVERSDSDGNFALVGVVEATGNSSVESNYEFIDLNPIRGVSYYRLSQTDYNGEQTILGVLSSEWPCQEGSDELMLYPNPSEGDVQVVFSHEGRDEYSVETFNAVGQVVLTPINGVAQDSGSTLIKLDTQELPVGVYMVRVKVGEKVFTEKLVRE